MKAGIRYTDRNRESGVTWIVLDRRDYGNAAGCGDVLRSTIQPCTSFGGHYWSAPPCIRRVRNRILVKQRFGRND